MGIAIGTIGALLWPSLFPNKTTTTTTTTTRAPVVGAVGAAIGAGTAADLGTVRSASTIINIKEMKLRDFRVPCFSILGIAIQYVTLCVLRIFETVISTIAV